MSTDVAFAEPGDSIQDVVARMRKHAYSCLVVTQDTVPVGIITERDIVRVYEEQSQSGDLGPRPVEEIMSKPPVVINETATLDESLALAEARRIRHLPIVDANASLTGIVTQTDLARCYRGVIEHEVHVRTAQLVSANRQLTEQQALLDAEEAIAKHVFDQLTVREAHTAEGLSVWNQPVGIFSGDLLLFRAIDDGTRHVLLGDFTGHGLSAALGAVPTASIFHAMTDKGLGMQEIEAELNDKLTTLLPVGYFCCVCLLEIDVSRSQARICNRGLPTLYVLDNDGRIKSRIASSGLPLGITASTAAEADWQIVPLVAGDRIYACSDGLSELRNDAGEVFGMQRVEQLLGETAVGEGLAGLRDAVATFLGSMQAQDDITVVEFRVSGPAS